MNLILNMYVEANVIKIAQISGEKSKYIAVRFFHCM